MGAPLDLVVGRPVTVVDVETTGLHRGYNHRVIEVAAIRFGPDGSEEGRWESLVDPERDIGAGHVHGITASALRPAPMFGDVAGTVLELMDGAVVIGHNTLFDLGFLREEFGRAGARLPTVPYVDTMHLPRECGCRVSGRSLVHVAESFGVPWNGRPHCAMADAEVTAGVFWRVVEVLASDGVRLASHLREAAGEDGSDGWPSLPVTAEPVTRVDAAEGAQRTFGFLSQLASRVDRMPVANWDEKVESYCGLLDESLEDHEVTAEEVASLEGRARMLGFSGEDIDRAHRVYFDRAVSEVWADGVVTDDEFDHLRVLARWFGMDDDIERLVAEAKESGTDKVPASVTNPYEGQNITITGAVPGYDRRQDLYDELETIGITVNPKNVTKKTDLLVVADPATKSGKAKKARQYGIRIMAVEVFLKNIRPHLPATSGT